MPPGAKRTPCAASHSTAARQVVDPQADVVERRLVHRRLASRDRAAASGRPRSVATPAPDDRDVLVDVLALAHVVAGRRASPRQSTQSARSRSLLAPPTAICCTPRIRNGRRSSVVPMLAALHRPAPSRSASHAAGPAALTRTSGSPDRPRGSRLRSRAAPRPCRRARPASTFCIFIASITTSRSPALTSWPGLHRDLGEQAGHRRQQEPRQVRRHLVRHQLAGARRRAAAAPAASICVPRCVSRYLRPGALDLDRERLRRRTCRRIRMSPKRQTIADRVASSPPIARRSRRRTGRTRARRARSPSPITT